MKKITIASLLFICSLSSYSQASGWAAYMMPGDVHKQLGAYAVANEWNVKFSVWTAADVTPESFDFKANIRTLMDGRFLEIHYLGEIMGMKYDALHQLGYNNSTNIFTHVEFSSFGTGFTILEGTWNSATKVATLKGQTISTEDKKVILLRETIKFIGPDQIVFEMYETRDGQKEFKTLEFILDKRK